MNLQWKWAYGVIAAVVLLLFTLPEPAWTQPLREITHIKGDVYRFRNRNHYSVFMVTPEGIVVTDPISSDAATWLRLEIEKRFKTTAKYLIYSHEHADHISGGWVFAGTALIIAHERAKSAIKSKKVSTAMPEFTFKDRHTVELGGKHVDLYYLGRAHTDNMIVMIFREERVAFAVDFVAVDRFPYRDFPGGYLDEWPDTLRALEKLEFDILAPGHGDMGTKEHVRTHREYIEELRNQVEKQLQAGKSPEEIKILVTMDKYKHWQQYDAWRELNVEGMLRHLQSK